MIAIVHTGYVIVNLDLGTVCGIAGPRHRSQIIWSHLDCVGSKWGHVFGSFDAALYFLDNMNGITEPRMSRMVICKVKSMNIRSTKGGGKISQEALHDLIRLPVWYNDASRTWASGGSLGLQEEDLDNVVYRHRTKLYSAE